MPVMAAKKKIVEPEIDIELTDDEDFASELGKDGQLKKLREKLKECQAEKSEYLMGWQRAKADYVNQKAENQTQLASATIRAKIALLEDILPALDSFAMAMKGEAWQNVDPTWRIGVEHIYKQLIDGLAQNEVETINPLNEQFNPETQQAVEEREVTDSSLDGVVIEVHQYGYKMKTHLIRPARVVVGNSKK